MAAPSVIGSGWAFPVRPGRSGRLEYVSDVADIERTIEIILRTVPRERVMNPDFGVALQQEIFLPNTPQTHHSIEHLISEGLQRLEPRISVGGVSATVSDEGPNILKIAIVYSILSTGATFTRVFKLSLTQES